MVYEHVWSVSDQHPSIAGHFPGNPIVPGVVLLNEVLATLRRGTAAPLWVMGLPTVKFSSPLRPGEVVTIQVDHATTTLATFSCRVDVRLIASGTIELRPGAMQAEQV